MELLNLRYFLVFMVSVYIDQLSFYYYSVSGSDGYYCQVLVLYIEYVLRIYGSYSQGKLSYGF